MLILNSKPNCENIMIWKTGCGKETNAAKTAFEESGRAMTLTHCSSSSSYLPPPLHHHHHHCHHHPRLCTNGASTGLGNSGKPTAPPGQPRASTDESTAPKNVFSNHYWSSGQPRGRRVTNLALIRRYECGQCLQAQAGLLLFGLEQGPGRGRQQGAGWQELSYQEAPFQILNSTVKGVVFFGPLKKYKKLIGQVMT